MGVIEKSIRKRSNAKLAAEAFTPTRLSFDEVAAAVQAFCDEANADVTNHIETSQANARTRLGKWAASLSDPRNSHYYVSPHPEIRQVLIGFGQRPEPILAGRGNTRNGVWAARLSYPAGGNTVGLALAKWVINSDGKLQHRSFYESLLENVHAAISSDPAGLAQDEPSDPAQDDLAQDDPATVAPAATANRAEDLVRTAAHPGRELDHRGRKPVPVPDPERDHRPGGPAGTAGYRHRLPLIELSDRERGHREPDVRVDAALAAACQRDPALRVTILTCGAPKPDLTFAHDWQLKYTVGDDGTALIEVPNYRPGNNEVRSAKLLAQLRAAVAESLASGVHLHLGEGLPHIGDLIAPSPAGAPGYPDNDDSPFRHDFLGGVPADGCAPLDLPAQAAGAVTDAMFRSHFRAGPGYGDDLCVASLAGGRAFDSGSVILRRTGEGIQLIIYIPAGLPPVELERSYRAALRCLERIGLNLKETEPGLCTTIGEHADRLATVTQKAWSAASGTRLRDRPAGLWTEHWNRSTAAPMVPVAAGRWYPIGILAVSPEQTNYVSRAAQAADWVSAFKRVKPVLGPNGRPTNRHTFTSRRCGLLHNANDQAQPYLRFAASELVRDNHMKGVSAPQAWFWEVNTRAVTGLGTSGPHGAKEGGLLLTTGWSHADGVLGYGENLLALFRAFADVVTATDRHARIHTLYLAT